MNKKLLTILLSVFLPTFLVGAVVYATTSIGDDITVASDLTVTATTTLNGDVILGNAATDTVTIDGLVSQTITQTTDEYTLPPYYLKWYTGADMAAGGAYGIFSSAYVGHDVQNVIGGAGKLRFDDTVNNALSINQGRGWETTLEVGSGDTITVTDDISALGIYVDGTSDVVRAGASDYATMNGAKVLWDTTKDFSIETNGVLVETHAGNYLDYGLHVRNSAGMVAGIYLDNHTSNSPSTMTTGILMDGATDKLTKGIDIASGAVTGIDIGAVSGVSLDITGLWGAGIANSAIAIGDYSNPLALGDIADNYIGQAIHLSATTTNSSNVIPLFVKFTTAGDNVANAVAQAIYGGVGVGHDLTDAYGVRGKVAISGSTPSVGQMFGVFAHVTTEGVPEITATGNIAGVGVLMEGTTDVTQAGSYAKVSGMYIAWKESDAMTVDTAGIYIANFASMNLDAGFRINSVGDTVSAFRTESGGGTVTNAFEVVAAHTYLLKVPATGTAPVETSTTDDAPVGRIKIKVGDDNRYLRFYND